MTRKELMATLKEQGIAFKATMKTTELEALLPKETPKKKAAYKREDQVQNIASVIPQDVYDRGCTIKLMSNKSVAVKKGRKRLFRLDRLAREYQLTSDRPTLAIDSRTEAVPYGDGKVFYRVRGDHDTVVEIMEKVLAAN